MAEVAVPSEFICPITKEIMADPVCTADGQTYERSAIEQWFASGRTSSPITGLPLHSTTLAPNFALKNAIETYRKDRPQMDAMAHQVKDLQACLAECERKLRRANARAVASVPNAEYVLLLKRHEQSGDASSNSTAEGSDVLSSDSDEHEYDGVVAEHKLWLQNQADMAEHASAQASVEREELAKEVQVCESNIAPALAKAAKEELRAVVLHKQMLALSEPLLQKEAERDAIGAKVMSCAEPLGVDGLAMLTAIRVNPAATWSGPLCAAYADLHCECLTLAGEKHYAHEAALAAQKAGVELRLLAHGLKAKLKDLQSRLQQADARVQAGDLEAKTASEAVDKFSDDDVKAKASWAKRVSWQPTAENLKKLAEMHEKCSAPLRKVRSSIACQLKREGYDVSDLKTVGFTASELREAGCAAAELSESFSAAELKDGGYTLRDLKDIGFTLDQLRGGGFTAGQLKDAGSTLEQLHQAGYNAGQLKDVGFSLDQITEVGFTLLQMKEGGITADQMKEAGITADQLREEGFDAGQLKQAGFSADQIKKGGFGAGQMKDGGFTARHLQDVGFALDQLKEAGFTAAQLKEAGFTAAQLKEADFAVAQLIQAGCSAAQLRRAGVMAAQLREAGFVAAQLREAGFTVAQLREAGFCWPSWLKDCGVTAMAC